MRRFVRVLVVTAAAVLTVVALSGSAAATSPTGNLVGTWNNVDPNTRGTVQVVISAGSNGALKVHVFGACHPTPCDNGTTSAFDYSSSTTSATAKAFAFTRRYSFATDIVTGNLKRGRLVVSDYTHYTDGSNRYDHVDTDTFTKQ